MQIICVRPFGNQVPGDVQTVPDGCIYDLYYFAPVETVAAPVAAPVAEGE